MQGIQFLPLSDVCRHGDDFPAAVFFQPRDDDGCIQSSGICQYDFFTHADALLSNLSADEGTVLFL